MTDRLTKPVYVEPSAEAKAADPTLKYLLIDEAKHCGRKPFKAKKWAGSNRADDDPGAKAILLTGWSTKSITVERKWSVSVLQPITRPC